MSENSTPPALARPEPLGMRQKRDVVDRDGKRYAEREGSRVRRRKKDVRFVPADRPSERRLLPPCAGSAGDDPGGGRLFREGHAERARRVKRESTGGRVITCGPPGNQLPEISSDAGHFSE